MKRFISIVVVLIVCGVTLAAAPAAKKPAKQAVSIRDMRFDPATVQVNVGDTVEWTNADVRDHTVVAGDGSFNSGNINAGDTFRYTFRKAGKFTYSCSLHPRMKGAVTVGG